MRVTDLLRAGGGLEDAAYGATAELTRYYVVDGERRRAELQEVDLAAALRGNPAANVLMVDEEKDRQGGQAGARGQPPRTRPVPARCRPVR